ncbi:MFS transporter [Streptococcus ruminicola]|uniref:MFS transporter n=1 Tax=Streptococcus ruminicola TaxID=2686210 RepID=UPI003F5F8355
MKLEDYGENILVGSKKATGLFLLVLASQLAFAGIQSLLLLKLMFLDKSGVSASYLTYIVLFASSISGLIGGSILSYFSKYQIGILTSLVSFIVVLIGINSTDNEIIYVQMAVIAFLNTLSVPNMSSTIPIISKKNDITKLYSLVQVGSQSIVLLAPIFVNLSYHHIGLSLALFWFNLLYLVSIIPWILVKRETSKVESKEIDGGKAFLNSCLNGYRIIFHKRELLDLNLFRIFNNLIYTSISTALPIIITSLAFSNKSITNLNTVTEFISGGVFILLGILLGRSWLKKRSNIFFLAYLTTVIALMGVVFLTIFNNKIGLLIFSAILGIGLFAGKISTIIIGQNITKQEELSITILSGDTLTKIVTLFFNYVFLQLLDSQTLNVYSLLIILGLISLSGNYFISNTEKFYKNG